MTITLRPAAIRQRRGFAHAMTIDPSGDPRSLHYGGYQFAALSSGWRSNVAIIPWAGSDLQLVDPSDTPFLLSDLTRLLPRVSEGSGQMSLALSADDVFGNLVVAPSYLDVIEASQQLPAEVRPEVDEHFAELVRWLQMNYPSHSFTLLGFSDFVWAQVVVQHHPLNDDVLTVPGVVAEDGGLPGESRPKGCTVKVCVSAEGKDLPIPVQYHGTPPQWAPPSVTGFWDNRCGVPNTDYEVPLMAVTEGRHGLELLETSEVEVTGD